MLLKGVAGIEPQQNTRKHYLDVYFGAVLYKWSESDNSQCCLPGIMPSLVSAYEEIESVVVPAYYCSGRIHHCLICNMYCGLWECHSQLFLKIESCYVQEHIHLCHHRCLILYTIMNSCMLYPKSASHFSHRLYHKLFVCPNASMLKEYIKQFSCQISGRRWLIPQWGREPIDQKLISCLFTDARLTGQG